MNLETPPIYSRYSTSALWVKFVVTLLLTCRVTKRLAIGLLKITVTRNIKVVTNILNGIYFCGETLSEAKDVTRMLAKNNIFSVLDYAVEGEEDELFFDDAVDFTLKLIELASRDSNIPYVVIKPSSLGARALYESRSRNDTDFTQHQPAWERVVGRYDKIFCYAHNLSVRVMIDAEQSWIQSVVDEIAMENMIKYNQETPIITLTLQCYKKGSYEFITYINDVAIKKGIKIGIKLVRGAYLEEEMKCNKHAAEVFFSSKSETDKNYNSVVDFIVANIENFTPFFATHNEVSINRILGDKRLSNNDFWLGQLYGVGDHVSLNAVNKGARVCKYLPYGPFEKTFPYLLRRIEENAVSLTTFRNENAIVRKEIVSRIISGKNE
ncbi:proline dehydrogenase family protein [Serratia marcescens]|nr:proline dehydrogenase family protein [Serratia marcescens]